MPADVQFPCSPSLKLAVRVFAFLSGSEQRTCPEWGDTDRIIN